MTRGQWFEGHITRDLGEALKAGDEVLIAKISDDEYWVTDSVAGAIISEHEAINHLHSTWPRSFCDALGWGYWRHTRPATRKQLGYLIGLTRALAPETAMEIWDQYALTYDPESTTVESLRWVPMIVISGLIDHLKVANGHNDHRTHRGHTYSRSSRRRY